MFDALGEPGFDWGRTWADLQNARDWQRALELFNQVADQRDQAIAQRDRAIEIANEWKQYAETLEREKGELEKQLKEEEGRRFYNVLEKIIMATDSTTWRELCYRFAKRLGISEQEVAARFAALRKVVKDRIQNADESAIHEIPIQATIEGVQSFASCATPIPPDNYPPIPDCEALHGSYDPARHAPYFPPKGHKRFEELELEKLEAELDLAL